MKMTIVLTLSIVSLAAFLIAAPLAQSTPGVDVSVSPQAFSPGSGGTIITYTISDMKDPDMLLSVKNQSGSMVRIWDLRETRTGQYRVAWDGKNDNGQSVPDGRYTVNASVMTFVQAGLQYQFQYSVPATAGKTGTFYYPYCVAVDASGNVYITDDYHHCVQKFDAGGKFLLKWGTPGSGNGQFRYPAGIAIDGNGNVYVADTGNSRIEKFDANGKFLAKWGGSGSGKGQLKSPYGVAVDSNGNIYVADTGNSRIQKFGADGTFKASWGSYGSGTGRFLSPYGIAVGPGGDRVYVTDSKANNVQAFTASGQFVTRWGNAGTDKLNTPYGVAIDSSGNVYVADGRNNRVQVFDTDGRYEATFGHAGSGNGQLNVPVGLAVSGNNLFVVDCWNHRYQSFLIDYGGQVEPLMFYAQAGVIVDSVPPAITIAAPADGASYAKGQKVKASWMASDGLSGLRSSSGTVASGSYLDTSKAGRFNIIVRATDNAGNTASVTRNYTVITGTPASTPGPTSSPTPAPAIGPAVQFTGSSGTGPTYSVEVARTSAEINRGLMYRKSLAEDAGMLFVFSGDYNHYFWMANTYIPLDMVYISSKAVVVGVYENAKPLSTSRITPPGPCHYVLEINSGQCALKGIKKGDKVKITGV